MNKQNVNIRLKGFFVIFLMCCIFIFFKQMTVYAEDTLSINVGDEISIADGGANNNIRSFPFLHTINGKQYVCFSQNIDGNISQPIDGMKISTDGGSTWPTHIQGTDFNLMSMIKLDNGDLLGMSYITYYVDATRAKSNYWKSTDNGATWTHYSGTVTYPQDQKQQEAGWGGFVFYRGMIQMTDGTLMTTMHGYYSGDVKSRCLWVKSMDGGASWQIVSTIASGIGREGPCEPVVAKCADNSLLCVFRVDSYQEGTTNGSALYQCRSNDNGLTWSTPVPLPGVSANDAMSVDPDMCLMSNGTLVLSYGRPNCKLLFSLDGSGNNWGNLTTTYIAPNWSLTTGYTGVREIAPNRLLVVGDKGASWSYPEADYEIWGKYVDVVRKSTFEYDTVGQRPSDYTVIGTDAVVSNTQAYEGTKSLRITDTSGSYPTQALRISNASAGKELEFKIYPVTNIYGISFGLFNGAYDTSNTVFNLGIAPNDNGRLSWYDGNTWHQLSGDSAVSYNQWNTIRIVAYGTSNANVYVNGTYVGTAGNWNSLSTINGAVFASCSVGGTGDEFYIDNMSFLDYNTSFYSTFETDTAGQNPYGYAVSGTDAVVSETQAYEGTKSLKITDTSGSYPTQALRISDASAGKELEFKIYPVTNAYGICFGLFNGAFDASNTVFYLGIAPNDNGRLSWYDGSTWYQLSGNAAVSYNQWNTIRIVAYDTSNADVLVNGIYAGTAGCWNSLSAINGAVFSSGSVAGTGDEFYIDNVSFQDYYKSHYDTFETDTAGQRPYGYAVTGTDAVVSNTQAYEGTKSLRITDTSGSYQTQALRVSDASAGKELEFRIYPGTNAYGICFGLFNGAYDTSNTVFNFAIQPYDNGRLSWYDGSTWHQLSSTSAVSYNQWNTIRIVAYDTSNANVYVNGTYVGTADNWNSLSTINGVGFASGSVAGTGDEFYIDNVRSIDYTKTILTFQTPTAYANDQQYELGTKFKSTISGKITKVRLYTNTIEGGNHTVRIWRVSDGACLSGPHIWSIASGTAGWKEYTLPSALSISANTDYIVSISNSADKYYASSDSIFPVNNWNSVTYSNSGVYTTSLGTMPTDSFGGGRTYFRDVVFECNTILSSQTPSDYYNDLQYELGTKFKSTISGNITKVRLYTNGIEGGEHTVRIWRASDGVCLSGPHIWNISSGTAGWKEYTLPSALSISADTDYIVSVSNSTDKCYAGSDSIFPVNNGNLVTYFDSGVYTTSLGTMPTTSAGGGRTYFRDVVFESNTVFTTQTPSYYCNDLQYELGTKFKSMVPGNITKVRLYTNATEGGSHTVRIWRASDGVCLSGPYTWDITSGTAGWKEYTLPSALSISADTDYIVSISNSTDKYYARHDTLFPITNGNLVTYSAGGVYTTSLDTMPTDTNGGGCTYFRDIVFVP